MIKKDLIKQSKAGLAKLYRYTLVTDGKALCEWLCVEYNGTALPPQETEEQANTLYDLIAQDYSGGPETS